ncbi:patatin-like phospholipase family protein [Herbaspirillum autotrophicum]|uniref:patatin-like phospholipase family protein n=1 Tax=Herbaspirillum autotrophicum TaxID=180195 RepID=UPI000A60E49E
MPSPLPFHCKYWLAAALIWSVSSHGAQAAAAEPAAAAATSRPRIGLVLSGGGARGYAHLGVLEYLEKLHIPIDYIAATSMGALIGGLYASGIAPDELEQKLSGVNLGDIAFDRNERAKLPQSQREDDFQYPISIAAGFGDGKIKVASGLVQGNNLLALLQNWTARLPADIEFKNLPIPFEAVATDLGKGTEVVLRQGSLSRAMRASMAVPGLFAPFQVDGRTLVDGGLVANLPVQQARDMGADIIIAVNIATPLQDPSALQSPTAVAQQMVGILIQQNVKAQKALLTSNDILIEPDLGSMTFTDFARGKDGINAGWEAAQQQSKRLTELALPPAEWEHYLASRRGDNFLAKDTRIDAIEINTHGKIPASYVRRQLSVQDGDVYDGSALNQELSRLSTNGDFNNVTQELVRKDGRNILKIDAEEKPWGPQYLLFGLGVSNNFDGRGGFNLQLGHRYPWLNASGLEWRNDVVFGNQRAEFHTELRQPLWENSGVYLAPYAELTRRRVDIYLDGADAKASPVNQYRIDTAQAGVDVGIPLARLGELRLGVNYQRIKYTPTYNFATAYGDAFDTTQTSQPGVRAQLTIDQLDDPLFPRKGYYIRAEANRGFGGDERRYSDVQLKTLWAFNRDRHTINLALESASSLGGEGGEGFFLGGFQRLSAYAPDQFFGSYLLYGRITYLNDLQDFNLAGLRNPVLGTSLELGNIWQQRDNFGNGPYKKSASVFVGGSSPIGPVYLGVAVGPQGLWNIYLQLGRVF